MNNYLSCLISKSNQAKADFILVLFFAVVIAPVYSQKPASEIPPQKYTLEFVGWSQNNKVAIGIKYDNDSDYIISYHYKIVDLISDKVIYDKTFKYGYAALADGFTAVDEELAGFRKKIADNSIMQTLKATSLTDPKNITAGQTKYAIELKNTKQGNIISSYDLDIYQSDKMKKVTSRGLADKNVTQVEYLFSILSPDSKRICIVLLERNDDNLNMAMYGSHLLIGFK
jgi:hypothetical protein